MVNYCLILGYELMFSLIMLIYMRMDVMFRFVIVNCFNRNFCFLRKVFRILNGWFKFFYVVLVNVLFGFFIVIVG